MRTIVDPCLVGSSVVSPVFVPSVSSSAQAQLQVSALPVSTVPPASSVTARDEDVPTPSGSPAGASSSRLAHSSASSCSTPSTDYKKLVRLVIRKVKPGSEMSSVEKQCLS